MFTQQRYGVNQSAQIRLKDADLLEVASVAVQVSTDAGDAESLLLTAVAGRFYGSIRLVHGALITGNDDLDVMGGEQLQVAYHDADNGAGQEVTVIDSATVVVDDFGNVPDEARDVAFGVPIEGDIEMSGDVDWFRFVVSTDMSYHIEVNLNGSLNDSVVELYDQTGNGLITADDDGGPGFSSRLTWQPSFDGTAYAKVFAYGSNVGTYQFVVSESIPVADDHGDNAAHATPLRFDRPTTGDLGALGDVDWFSFTATAGMAYEISTELLTLEDSILRLIDTDGFTQLVYSDDAPDGFYSQIVWHATATGTQYVEVSGYNDRLGEYRVNVHEFQPPPDDHGDAAATATPIRVPSETAGELALQGDADWFTFTAVRGNVYQFDVQLTTLTDSVIRILDSQGNELAYNDDFDGGRASRVSWLAPDDGAYYVEVAGYDLPDVGTYQLLGAIAAVRPEDDHGNDAATASLLPVPAAADGRIEIPGDVDWFHVPVVAGLVYNIETRAGSLEDTILQVFASDGMTVLAENDDHGLLLTSYLQWQATESATVYLKVSAYSHGQGTYTLSGFYSSGRC